MIPKSNIDNFNTVESLHDIEVKIRENIREAPTRPHGELEENDEESLLFDSEASDGDTMIGRQTRNLRMRMRQ
jgi:hypothetical protein